MEVIHKDERWLVDHTPIYDCMLSQELRRPVFGNCSPQLDERPAMVSWINQTCHHFKLHETTKHLSVVLMDMFMDHYIIIDAEQLNLLCLGSILISAKVEEKELDIPKATEIANLHSVSYSLSLCMKMELLILKHFQWKVSMPTIAHFCEYFNCFLIDERQDLFNTESWNASKAISLCQDAVSYFLGVTLTDTGFYQDRPSRVGAAIMLATRTVVDLSPTWPDRMEERTGYTSKQLQKTLEDLLRHFSEDQAKQERDEMVVDSDQGLCSPSLSSGSSGYLSCSPSPQSRASGSPDPNEMEMEQN